MNNKSIVIYTSPTCPNCEQLKRYLEANDIAFETKDIMEDPANRDFIISKGFRGVPVTVIDDADFVQGFKPMDILNLLKK